VLKVISLTATLPTHTDGSIVLARWHQCWPSYSTPRSASVPYRFCWVTLSISTARHVWTWPGPVPFRPQNCPFTLGIWTFLGTHSKWHLDQFSRVWQTDRPRNSICRPRAGSGAV